MVKLEYKLKAFSLIETIVAMVIILIIIGIAFTILIQVNKNSNAILKTRAIIRLNNEVALTRIQKSYLDMTSTYEDFVVVKTIEDHYKYFDVKVLHVEVKDKSNRTVIESHEIISYDH